MEIKVRVISRGSGRVEGEALVSKEPISFFGGVNPDNGIVVEKDHELEGKSLKGKILVFPRGKGSTVGSYTLYRMKKQGTAPLAIINEESEVIVAAGAILAGIPLVDKADVRELKTGQKIVVDASKELVIY